MGSDRIEELLLQLIQDMAELKAKINAMDEQKLASRIDFLEAQTREQERVIKSLEKRADIMDEFTRNNLNDKNKTHISVWIGIGMALFGAIVSFIMNLL